MEVKIKAKRLARAQFVDSEDGLTCRWVLAKISGKQKYAQLNQELCVYM